MNGASLASLLSGIATVMGILCAAASLAEFGADNMVIPAMVLVLAVLLGARRRLDRSGEEGDL